MDGRAYVVGRTNSTSGVSALCTNVSQEDIQHGTFIECHIIDAIELKTYFVPKVYVHLKINKLIKMISSRGNRTIKKPITVS